MADAAVDPKQTPPTVEAPSPEVAVAEIDKVLEQDDPDFTKQLAEVKEVGAATDVVIESEVAGEETLSTESEVEKKSLLSRFPRLEKRLQPAITRTKTFLFRRWLKFRAIWLGLSKQTWYFLKSLPSLIKGGVKAVAGALSGLAKGIKTTLGKLSRWQKVGLLFFSMLLFLAGFLVKSNLHGVWIPSLLTPIVTDVTKHADQVWVIDEKETFIPFYKAFPQEEIEVLLPKIVVNLKRTRPSHNTMGAFEFYLVVDSKDAAFEVKAREHELHDKMQRTVEGLTYDEINSPLGKRRLKDLLRKDLNDALTQGWVKEVFIKTLILKP